MATVLLDVNLLHDTGNGRPVCTLEGDGTRSAVSNPADLRELDSPVGIVDVFRSKLRNPKTVTDRLSKEGGLGLFFSEYKQMSELLVGEKFFTS